MASSPLPRIKVLVVDDSSVIRHVVAHVIAMDPAFEIVGHAANGKIALEMLPRLNPDLVTLDIEMPEMDGIETLKRLRKTHPRLPVIMFSTLTERGAAATVEALACGATDYAAKPSGQTSLDSSIQTMQVELIPKLRALFPQRAMTSSRPAFSGSVGAELPSAPVQPIDLVVIGASTGGPGALQHILPKLPRDLCVPVLVVQHMPPVFTQALAERLNDACPISVREAVDREPLTRGTVLIAPGDVHLEVAGVPGAGKVRLHRQPPENSCRPSVDVLFRSAAQMYGGNVLAVMLTGMGQDGLKGSQLIAEAQGFLIVQDQATSVVWGMPGAVQKAGIANCVLPLQEIGPAIVSTVNASLKKQRVVHAPSTRD